MELDPYPLFSVFAFIGFIVALIPLPWHLQALNAGTCIFMLWASLSSLIQFVDSVVWHNSVANVAPIWCDISTKFLIGAGVGIPAASLCINRRLYKIACIQTVSITRQERRRAIFADMAIAIGLPVVVMILHVVVQGHRFNILEDVGCIPTIYNTPPAYPLVFMWPVLIGCVSFCYAFLTLRSFWRRRIEFSALLSSSTSLTTSRYLRLMLLSCTEMVCTIPLGAYSIYANVGGIPIARWTNWADVHFNFGFVQIIPASIWQNNHRYVVAVEMGRWIYPCSAMLFFALFGFAEEARRNYALAFRCIKTCLGFKPNPDFKKGPHMQFVHPKPPKLARTFDADDALPAYSPSSGTLASPTSSFGDKCIDIEKTADSPSSFATSFVIDERSSITEHSRFSDFSMLSGPAKVFLPSSPTDSSISDHSNTAVASSPSSPVHPSTFTHSSNPFHHEDKASAP